MKFSPLMLSGLAGFLIVVGTPSSVRAADSAVQIRRTNVPTAIARLSTVELIDKLQDEAGEKIDLGSGSSTVHFAALTRGFAPVDAPAAALERNITSFPRSPVITELVSRGLESLPLLLEHLSDSRPTRCAQIVQFGFGGPGGFADKYDSRYREPDRQPKNVNMMTGENFKAFKTKEYVLRVGDLCYHAVGQIVNRQLEPVSTGLGINNRALTINSPVESEALAAATRSDWQGLTAAEHETILRADALDDGAPRPRRFGEPALKRLLYYYAEAGKSEAERRLSADLDPDNLYLMEWFVYEMNAFDWPGLIEAYHQLFERAKRLEPDDAGKRFIRDQIVLTIARKIENRKFYREVSVFLRAEITWWEHWQKETAAAPWFRKPGKKAELSNLWPSTKQWCADASAFVAAKNARQ